MGCYNDQLPKGQSVKRLSKTTDRDKGDTGYEYLLYFLTNSVCLFLTNLR